MEHETWCGWSLCRVCVRARVSVYWYKVGWRAHTLTSFFVFLICTRLHIIRRAQTASARQRPRAAGWRRGLIGWEDESHQVLHINCWVIADTEIISSRTEAGGCGKHVTSLKLLCTVQFDELNRDVFHMCSTESVLGKLERGFSFREGTAFSLKGKKQLVKSWFSCSVTMQRYC